MTFGEYVKQKRLEKGYSLREFCRLIDVDASNWSKVERGRLKAPLSKLFTIAFALKFHKKDKNTLEDLANISQNLIPEPLQDNEVIKHLPLLCEAFRDKAKRERLIKLLKENL